MGSRLLFVALLFTSIITLGQSAGERYAQVKVTGFSDPYTGYLYRVTSYNVTTMTTGTTFRSIIRVSRVRLDGVDRRPIGQPENIQTLGFNPTLVDFDLHCQPSHCYLVTVTSNTRLNLDLYHWRRTQFDSVAKRDSFARPYSVKLFKIQSAFYIAVAQDQLHLASVRYAQEYEEPARFIGCALLKFTRGHEQDIRYHQFIRLPFNPHHVSHFTSTDVNNISLYASPKPAENHYLIFSADKSWTESRSFAFQWSPLNEYFWPYQLPKRVEVAQRPGSLYPSLQFPPAQATSPNGSSQTDQSQPVESCFFQLQRLLADRELHARRLIDSSRTLWRSSPHQQGYRPMNQLSNISAQVIVHGNVIVTGSIIESPQISLIGRSMGNNMTRDQMSRSISDFSPAIVENRLMQAHYKLKYMRDKLASAVPANDPNPAFQFNSKIKFYGNLDANEVVFTGNGLSNSDVRLNGIPFKQLEHELVSLKGSQEIAARVRFNGNVVADLLEIHGLINGRYFLKDALDITTNQLQVIEAGISNLAPGQVGFNRLVEFNSVTVPQLVLAHNASLNQILLGDFILRDNRTQQITGKKWFSRLSMGQLNLENAGVLLNGFNIGNLAKEAIRLKAPEGRVQVLTGKQLFAKHVQVNRLIVNNKINNHINLTSVIHDSVKRNDLALQQISGHKNFLSTVKILHLTTDGSINDVQVDQMFNLNPYPPSSDYLRYTNAANYLDQPAITGAITFNNIVTMRSNLAANLVNGVDIGQRAIRRTPPNEAHLANSTVRQIITGKKIFGKPLRVIDRIRLLDNQQLTVPNRSNARAIYPLINGIDLKLIKEGISRQKKNPSVIYIDNLEIDGNLHLDTPLVQNGPPRVTFGNFSVCPLDLIRSKAILTGSEEQTIDVPIRVNNLRARSAYVPPNAMNGWDFPRDFVLRSTPDPTKAYLAEPVFGHKTFEHISLAPPLVVPTVASRTNGYQSSVHNPVIFGPFAQINNISYSQLQKFITKEREFNSTGETILRTLNVHGNVRVKRINGNYWPEDILLKSVGTSGGPAPSPYLHRRIYSPLLFTETSALEVINQLVLRGPIQLAGRMNGVNLTELARQAITYGDKDLFSVGRPIKNKIFLGGLTVNGELRSNGLINGISFDEMRSRVVPIRPSGNKVQIMAHKAFLSDVHFHAPVNVMYLNDIAIDHYLRRIQFTPGTNEIIILGKKTITGTLKINKNLIVQGLINKIDFADLKARAIPLSPPTDELTFNRTLTVEGDVFMDNLLIDEKNGTIDGVKLTNLLPVDRYGKNELVVSAPSLQHLNATHGQFLNLGGHVQECQISCNLAPAGLNQTIFRPPMNHYQQQSQHFSPQNLQANLPMMHHPVPHQTVSYSPRQIVHNGRNVSYMRTTPPYATQAIYDLTPIPLQRTVNVDQKKAIRTLATRQPNAIIYERPVIIKKYVMPTTSRIVVEQLDILKKQIVSLNLITLSHFSDLVIGFIETPTNELASLQFVDQEPPPVEHLLDQRSFLRLDQVDFPFRPTTYHLSVGIHTNHQNQSTTTVYSSMGDSGEIRQLSVLPIESPNSAMFLKMAGHQQTLFLLISQDYTSDAGKQRPPQCPLYLQTRLTNQMGISVGWPDAQKVIEGIHVYLFHALQNSSSLTSAYFDLYQTIDLPPVDSFEKFEYRGSQYVLAVSRPTSRVYLLLLRGYSGFQVVSDVDAPMVEYVKVAFSADQRPILIIYQTNGMHRLMESVII